MASIKGKIRHMTFNKKMQLFVAVAISLVALIIFVVTIVYQTTSMTNKSKKLAYEQVSLLSDNFSAELYALTQISYGINLNSSIQNYLRNQDSDTPTNYSMVNQVSDDLRSYLNMNPNINFIAVVDNAFDDTVYSGYYALIESDFNAQYKNDFDESIGSGRGLQKINFGSAYFDGDNKTLTVYQPLIDTSKLNRRLGTLCLNVNKDYLLPDNEKSDFSIEMYVIDTAGRVVMAEGNDTDRLDFDLAEYRSVDSGSFVKDHSMYVLKKINQYDFYIVGKIPVEQFYKEAIYIAVVMAVLVFMFVLMSVFVVSHLIERNYQPMKKVVESMEKMVSGDLSTRLPLDDSGVDFLLLTEGFNDMMDTIDRLINEVKTEHDQKEQIRFNALQSQIKPHFLYNTLDSIHWSAAADGNKEVSRLVKALASYYRLCLSKGEDIISLGLECEQVTSYMDIQNIRYNQMVTFTTTIPIELSNQKIPKMTLQPLVENAIYHGIRIKENKTGCIEITAKREEDRVIVMVGDDGRGANQEDLKKINEALMSDGVAYGYGLQNVNKRIKLLYGNHYGLMFHSNRSGGITVEVHLPNMTQEDWQHSNQGEIIL